MNINMTKIESGISVASANAEDSPVVTEVVTTEFRKDKGGAVSIASLAEKETKDEAGGTTINFLSTADGSVTADIDPGPLETRPKQEDDLDIDITVSTDEVTWASQKTNVNISEEVTQALHALVGMQGDYTRELLSGLVDEGSIGSFRTLMPGQSYTQEFVSDRVQLLIDKDGVVQDVHVG